MRASATCRAPHSHHSCNEEQNPRRAKPDNKFVNSFSERNPLQRSGKRGCVCEELKLTTKGAQRVVCLTKRVLFVVRECLHFDLLGHRARHKQRRFRHRRGLWRHLNSVPILPLVSKDVFEFTELGYVDYPN